MTPKEEATIRRKVAALRRLARSDNPHEAELAKIAAEKWEAKLPPRLTGFAPSEAKTIRDWHEKWNDQEPECGPLQWRTQDRGRVIDIADMNLGNLVYAYKKSQQKRQHQSRMRALRSEMARRQTQQALKDF